MGTHKWYLLIHRRGTSDNEGLERAKLYIIQGLIAETRVHLHEGVTHGCKEEGGI